ncbi:GtrA family protein [Gordonibacter massiliensis (ex Traore et al. 2017)]|uniref:GtrA family protein n=1 Tax=Gordonibacter massiliensis (ex Traore et al. 2017) TaxID=1841863 RepID=UPI001C8BDACA|nr:GtrA family protein [Gordonibacter massiliensis (ex Traore et al. 2017)]MBX9033620.1 GtrA family protein [Gordonibacter massiliensis (ex Traore et al. 2017)]
MQEQQEEQPSGGPSVSMAQFIKFGLVGVSNTLVFLAIYYLVLFLQEDWYLFGNALGWAVSVLNAFFWGDRVVFKNSKRGRVEQLKKLGKSYITYGATFLLSTVLLYFEIGWWDISSVVAPLINLLVTIPLNFFINKYWTFK